MLAPERLSRADLVLVTLIEAQITKLKMVKRQMYGRASLDLLRARLVGVA